VCKVQQRKDIGLDFGVWNFGLNGKSGFRRTLSFTYLRIADWA
jgi:hypothetical protein